MILIIDSMCNIRLLLYDAASSNETQLVDMITTHARPLLTTRLGPESLRRKAKNKNGYTASATRHTTLPAWIRTVSSRRSATLTPQHGPVDTHNHPILGYARTYTWTKKARLLSAACGAAESFLHRLDTALACVDVPVEKATVYCHRVNGERQWA